ncbi:GNAT family N-acetyltransferase [Oerskovia flava]|uniref:GNAT family N-acetyltransferase n=1 Tax=Oerskovia flava TaxID=2986422 RepID=UPI0022400428|nr:GNAT family N-acetyltransferase [Oerskovia sp. JB1-3-2]
MPTITLEPLPPSDPDAARILHEYVVDVAARYYGRAPTPRELADALADSPPQAVAAPHGALLVARLGEDTVGCAGVRFAGDGIEEGTGEVTRVFVAERARRRGVASALVTGLEDLARARGVRLLRLDTRTDLVEARALYARLGYREVPAFNDEPYADHWFAKPLPA